MKSHKTLKQFAIQDIFIMQKLYCQKAYILANMDQTEKIHQHVYRIMRFLFHIVLYCVAIDKSGLCGDLVGSLY